MFAMDASVLRHLAGNPTLRDRELLHICLKVSYTFSWKSLPSPTCNFKNCKVGGAARNARRTSKAKNSGVRVKCRQVFVWYDLSRTPSKDLQYYWRPCRH